MMIFHKNKIGDKKKIKISLLREKMLEYSENYQNYHELSLKNVKKYTFLLKMNQ